MEHNNSVNKLGYSPLKLVTWKAVTISGLTMGTEATESIADSEVVQITMETINKTISKFENQR